MKLWFGEAVRLLSEILCGFVDFREFSSASGLHPSQLHVASRFGLPMRKRLTDYQRR